jgi:putative transposase
LAIRKAALKWQFESTRSQVLDKSQGPPRRGTRPQALQDWLKAQEIKTLYITPGSPWENGHIESFHDKLRDECLNRELFGNLHEARVILESWRVEYSECRRTVRLATAPRASMPGAGRTGSMGVARPQTPRRSPRQAFGGN